MSRHSIVLYLSALIFASAACQQPLVGQQKGNQVEINFTDELSLETLAELISKKLNLNIIYDKGKIKGKKISLKAPDKLKDDQLISLLQSALRTHGMILVEDDVDGFRRIVDRNEAAAWANRSDDFEQVERDFGAPTLGSATFFLKNLAPQSVKPLVDFLVGKDGSKVTMLDKQNAIAVTGRTDALAKISRMLKKIDVPQPQAVYNFYTAKNLSSTDLKQKLTELLAAKFSSEKNQKSQLFDVPRTNQLAIIGSPDWVRETLGLVEKLDVSLGRETKIFNLEFVSANRVQTLLENLTKNQIGKEFDAVVDEESNMLVITATEKVLKTAQNLVTQLDVESQKEKSPIRFYRLKNISAVEALETIRALQGLSTGPTLGSSGLPRSRNRGTNFEGFPFNNNIPFNPIGNGFNQNFQTVPTQNGFGVPLGSQTRNHQSLGAGSNGVDIVGVGDVRRDEQVVPVGYQQQTPTPASPRSGVPRLPVPDGNTEVSTVSAREAGLTSELFSPNRAQVTADVNTNSLIVIADETTQRIYEELIDKVDRRSPQVLIEAKIVTVDTSNQFSLGIEVSGGDRTGESRLFGFSQFGLSSVDLATGALSFGDTLPGFNGALLRPEEADVLVNALSAHSRAKVIASPRILVNENNEGVIESVVSQPFASINSTNAAASTSLGGNQEAGTTISVVPHISDGDHLELDFSIEFSSFQGDATATLPPPRQITSIQSVATIPDGHTVIVGGLNQESVSGSVSAIPWLKEIPIIRDLSKNRSSTNQNSALFIFIRPLILRDDQFQNLRFLSRQAEKNSRTEYPFSAPVIMR